MKLIVGIDPGTTTGIALLDMNSESEFSWIFSKKDISLASICEYIAEKGEPVIIATDVKKPPAAVKKIAAAFNAILFKPKRTITQYEKRKLVKSAKAGNKHEKDALAAAILAKKRFSSLIRKIDSALKKRNMLVFSEQVKEIIIRHKAGNIEQAIRLVRE